ncbi:Na/Pi cotransporter family protein [Hydrogenimonas urashimensis]|uniref:Na/Pi cotransporter family protein n=1 Tax=Hydrogenimonas urashimensis TaxID=2740515 RepID=UPI0019152E8C|nr:Na/Pi symporter [Hydrogenimonas urashimensis]
MESLKIWIEAFSGLGLFLFGMIYLESQIRLSAGRAFRRWIRFATGTRFRSFLAGLFATALFQSSSVVTLMAISLIGAGLMSLEHAIAVIFGANIGTTVTAWIVGFVGFKMDIKILSYAFIGIGGLASIFLEEGTRTRSLFNAMVGFGLIFLGLEGMKESFSLFAEDFDIGAHRFAHLGWYALMGLGVTALIQSSSASIAIVQSALFAHIIGFEAAAAFVIGSNVGTTVTAILGAVGGSPDKKRTALAHFLFNVSTGIVALLAIGPLLKMTEAIWPGSDPVIRIALFHSLFNVLGVAMWYPLIPFLTAFMKRFFKKEKAHVTHYIHNVSADLPEVARDALFKEILHLAEEVENFALLAVNTPPQKVLAEHLPIDKLLDTYDENMTLSYARLYAHIRRLEGEILRFITELSGKRADERFQADLDRMARTTAYLATAAKSIKDMLHDIDRWYDEDNREGSLFLRNLRYQIIKSVRAFHGAFKDGERESFEEMERFYKRIAQSYRNSMQIIGEIAKNRSIASEMTTIAINDLHLSKSFSKSLRNAVREWMKGVPE